MNGRASGNWFRRSRKPVTEDQRAIDVRYLSRRGLLRPRAIFSLSWRSGDKRLGSVGVRTKRRSTHHTPVPPARSQRQVAGRSRAGPAGQNAVPLRWQPVLVPLPRRGTGRRVAILCGAGRYFACRTCYGLTYHSTREDLGSRYPRKALAIRQPLAACGGMSEPLPPKPKWMRWRTYWRLVEQCQEYEAADLFLLASKLGVGPSVGRHGHEAQTGGAEHRADACHRANARGQLSAGSGGGVGRVAV